DVAAFDVDPTTGAPRFKLAYHTVGQSLALPIARRHGLPARALETAERLLTGESRDLARAVARLEESRRAYEADREEVERERARLAAARVEAEALAEDLRARQRRRWAEDLDASRRFLRELEARGRTMLEELRRRPEPAVLRTFVRQASDALAAFLDRAVRAGLSEVRVVHGIGSGALRRAVHEFLESSPYCAGFRESEPAAGGAGVTIAELG